MNTPYDILGVHRSASEEAIKAAFHSAAKACHPDLNGGDLAAAQKLKQIIAAYHVLKSPERRADYDQLLRDRRCATAKRLMTSTVASLAGGGVLLLAIWLLGAQPHEQVATAPTASSSATEWERADASREASSDRSASAPSSHSNASEAVKVVGREEPREPVGVTTKAAVRVEPASQNPEAVTTKVALHEEPAGQELEGDTMRGREEPAVRKLMPAIAVKRLAKVHDPVRPVTAEIRSPTFFGVGF
jgi:curved DNA-binding protein CbpA